MEVICEEFAFSADTGKAPRMRAVELQTGLVLEHLETIGGDQAVGQTHTHLDSVEDGSV